MQERWADNRGVRIHFFDTEQSDSGHVPALVIPGALGAAEGYLLALPRFLPRRVVVPSLRGRGQSDAPTVGYSFEEHVGDVEAVVAASGLGTFCLVAYSVGVAYALGYAARHPERLAGLVVCDFPAHYPALAPGWEKRASAIAQGRVEPHVIRALQRESCEIALWDTLDRIRCPVLVVRGGQPGSLLSAEETTRYVRCLREVETVILARSGHALWKPDMDEFVGAIAAFLCRLDEGKTDPADGRVT